MPDTATWKPCCRLRASNVLSRIIIGLTVIGVIQGCASTSERPPAVSDARVYVAQEESFAGGKPTVGLALAGGGQKSAPFAMGVLAELVESGELSKIDVVSSVSGGGYAALYLFTRAAEEYASPSAADSAEFTDAFRDCLPQARKQYLDEFTFTRWQSETNLGECPHSDPGLPWRNYWNADEANLEPDPLRYASQVRASQSLFSKSWDYEGTTQTSTKTAIVVREAAITFANSVVFFVPSFLANSVFDWRTDLFALGKHQYNQGIQRAYGTTPVRAPTFDSSVLVSEWVRPPGTTQVLDGLTFTRIREIFEESRRPDCAQRHRSACHLPLWVVNATAGTSKSVLESFGVKDFVPDQNVFEFSPYGYGSGGYGYRPWGQVPSMEPTQYVKTAVSASAAFFDSQQQQIGGVIGQAAINVGLQVINFEWGTNIRNYGLGEQHYRRQKALHAFLPWPIYLWHHHQADRRSLNIHLSDGGMSENLGVWSLLRRGVRDIIVVDSASDANYQMSDLCELERQLEILPDSPAWISFVGIGEHGEQWDAAHARLGDFAQTCRDLRDGRLRNAKDPFGLARDLPAPVLKARVCSGRTLCSEHDALARLFIIKPALQMRKSSASGAYTLSDALDPRHASHISQGECGLTRAEVASSTGYPCEVVAFMAIQGNFIEDVAAGTFPQNSTVRMSALSSPYMYGAYRELARYYAKALRISQPNDDGVAVHVDLERFWRAEPAAQLSARP